MKNKVEMKNKGNYFLFVAIIFAMANQGCKKDLPRKSKLETADVDPYYVTKIADIQGHGIAAIGDYLYFADPTVNGIKRITISNNEVIRLAGATEGFTEGYKDGLGSNAKFQDPYSMAAGPDGNLYVTDIYNYKIRKVTPEGLVSTFAGCDSGYVNGPVKSSASAKMAEFGFLRAIGIAKDGTMFVFDFSVSKIRKISTAGIVSDYAGSTRGDQDGSASTAKFADVEGIAVADDGTLYVADELNNKIKKITTDGTVTTIAGSTRGDKDGPALTAKFYFPVDVKIAADGSLYITDAGNSHIRKLSTTGIVTTVAGIHRSPLNEDPSTSGPGSVALLYFPFCAVIHNNILYFTGIDAVSSLTLP